MTDTLAAEDIDAVLLWVPRAGLLVRRHGLSLELIAYVMLIMASEMVISCRILDFF